jgi:hypothetical protein
MQIRLAREDNRLESAAHRREYSKTAFTGGRHDRASTANYND